MIERNNKLSPIERETIVNMTIAMRHEEQQLVAENLPTDILINELERRSGKCLELEDFC